MPDFKHKQRFCSLLQPMTFTHIIITSQRGSQEGETALSFGCGQGAIVPPEADAASLVDACSPGLLGDIVQLQSTYSL